MRKVRLFTIGVVLTFQAILGDNSYKRAMLFARLTYPEIQIVMAGEAITEGVFCAIVCITLMLTFFYIFGLIP